MGVAYHQLHTDILNPLTTEIDDNGDPESFFGSLYAYGETHHEHCLQKYVPVLIEAYKNGGVRNLKRTWHDLENHELFYCNCGVTADDGTPYEFAKQEILDNRYAEDVAALIHRVKRDYRSWVASGEEGQNPLQQLFTEYTEAIREINDLLTHVHFWNEDGYCFVCGIDGHT
jgi:hypothetical protein